MYSNLVKNVRKVTADVTTAWIPEKPWVLAFSLGALWYGRKVAIEHAPKIISNYLVSSTLWGQYVVAPVAAKTFTPYVVIGEAFLFFYTAAVIGNCVVAIFAQMSSSTPNTRGKLS